MEYLISVLKASSEKHGSDKPLTIGHLLNIALLADKLKTDNENKLYLQDVKAYNDAVMSKFEF